MFQNVRDTRRVRRRCAEGNPKHLVVVIGSDRQELGTTLFVTIECAVGTILGHNILLDDIKGWVGHFEGLLEFGGCCDLDGGGRSGLLPEWEKGTTG